MAGEKCTPPKGQRVKEHWRAAPRRRRRILRADETYYVAEDKHGHECDHHHKTWSGAASCAARMNKKAHRKGGSRPDYIVERHGPKK